MVNLQTGFHGRFLLPVLSCAHFDSSLSEFFLGYGQQSFWRIFWGRSGSVIISRMALA